MTLVELKKSIHERIDNLEDEHLLEMVNELIQDDNAVYEVPPQHAKDIDQGIEDIKNGDFITLDEFEKRYEKWLKD